MLSLVGNFYPEQIRDSEILCAGEIAQTHYQHPFQVKAIGVAASLSARNSEMVDSLSIASISSAVSSTEDLTSSKNLSVQAFTNPSTLISLDSDTFS